MKNRVAGEGARGLVHGVIRDRGEGARIHVDQTCRRSTLTFLKRNWVYRRNGYNYPSKYSWQRQENILDIKTWIFHSHVTSRSELGQGTEHFCSCDPLGWTFILSLKKRRQLWGLSPPFVFFFHKVNNWWHTPNNICFFFLLFIVSLGTFLKTN